MRFYKDKRTGSVLGVNSEEAYQAMKSNKDIFEEVEQPTQKEEITEEDKLSALREVAKELGVKNYKRLGEEKLLEAIDKAQAV